MCKAIKIITVKEHIFRKEQSVDMKDRIYKIAVALIIIIYIVSPFDFPGPVDDIIVAVIGSVIEYRLGHKTDKDDENDK